MSLPKHYFYICVIGARSVLVYYTTYFVSISTFHRITAFLLPFLRCCKWTKTTWLPLFSIKYVLKLKGIYFDFVHGNKKIIIIWNKIAIKTWPWKEDIIFCLDIYMNFGVISFMCYGILNSLIYSICGYYQYKVNHMVIFKNLVSV